MNLKDILTQDNKYIFSVGDISENVLISTKTGNERTVLGSLQADDVTFNSPIGTALNAYNFKLYIEEQPDMEFNKNTILYVNKRAYKVMDTRLEMGVREISLEARQ